MANRTEQEVLDSLDEEERAFLRSVLLIELSRLQTREADKTRELLDAIKGVVS